MPSPAGSSRTIHPEHPDDFLHDEERVDDEVEIIVDQGVGELKCHGIFELFVDDHGGGDQAAAVP